MTKWSLILNSLTTFKINVVQQMLARNSNNYNFGDISIMYSLTNF